MKFKNDFPSNIEWTVSKINHPKWDIYDFECWEQGSPSRVIKHLKADTANALAHKINKFLKTKEWEEETSSQKIIIK